MTNVDLYSYLRCNQIKADLNDVGLDVCAPAHQAATDAISVIPVGEAWPGRTTRNRAVFTGKDFQSVRDWFEGVQFATQYYKNIGLFTAEQLNRVEQDIRNAQLMERLKEGCSPAVSKDVEEEEDDYYDYFEDDEIEEDDDNHH